MAGITPVDQLPKLDDHGLQNLLHSRDDLQEQLDAIKKQYAALQADHATALDSNGKLTAAVSAANAERDKAKAEHDDLQTQHNALLAAQVQLKADHTAVKDALAKAENVSAQASAERDQAKAQLAQNIAKADLTLKAMLAHPKVQAAAKADADAARAKLLAELAELDKQSAPA